MAGDVRRFPRISDEMVAALRARIGETLKDPYPPWVTEATRDNSRHYAFGIGDDNPLWWDEAYARETPFGDIVAVPTILFSCSPGGMGLTGLPGIHAMFGGCHFRWHRPIRRNERITARATIKGVIEKQTRFSGRTIQQIHHMEFEGEGGAPLAWLDVWNFRTDRDEARQRGEKYDRSKTDHRRHYNEEELDHFLALYDAEEVRGAVPRYWEDVSVGDRLGPIAKGPMTVTGFIAYLQGWGGIYIRAHKLFHRQLRKLPALAIRDRYGIPDVPEAVHWREDFATLVGAPGIYDYGSERCSWLGHLATNWMGDAGFLLELQVRLRRHNMVGELLRIDGVVAAKRRTEQDGALVDVTIRAVNQDDELSAEGSAIIRLPTRT